MEHAEAGAQDVPGLLKRCRKQEFLVFSMDSDASFYLQEQAKLVHLLKRAQVPVMWITVHSDKGHDSFLLEPRLYTPHLKQVLGREAGRGASLGPLLEQACVGRSVVARGALPLGPVCSHGAHPEGQNRSRRHDLSQRHRRLAPYL
jgi:hypothetical protein